MRGEYRGVVSEVRLVAGEVAWRRNRQKGEGQQCAARGEGKAGRGAKNVSVCTVRRDMRLPSMIIVEGLEIKGEGKTKENDEKKKKTVKELEPEGTSK